jgi:hypothetical protein
METKVSEGVFLLALNAIQVDCGLELFPTMAFQWRQGILNTQFPMHMSYEPNS